MDNYMDQVKEDIAVGNDFVAWFVEVLGKIMDFFAKVKELFAA